VAEELLPALWPDADRAQEIAIELGQLVLEVALLLEILVGCLFRVGPTVYVRHLGCVVGSSLLLAIGRAGLFRSTDQGAHWTSAGLEPLNPKGQTYCRDIREVPGDPRTIWLAAGANFQSDVGVLFKSKDGGSTWARVDMGVVPQSTMFAVVFDERQPRRMFCATTGGEVFASADGGQSWAARPLPAGATQVYAMGCA